MTTICTIVTKDAIMTIYAGILTFDGITFLSADMAILEHISTIEAATPIPRALSTEVETARVGQVPSTRRSTGFSLTIPLVNS